MAKALTEKDAEALNLFRHRNRLLTAIREHSLRDPEEQNYAIIFQHCCNILAGAFHCNFVWAGDFDREENKTISFAAMPHLIFTDSSVQNYLTGIFREHFSGNPSANAKPLYSYLPTEHREKSATTGYNFAICPVGYQNRVYGFVAMHCKEQINSCDLKMAFIGHIIDDVALAVYSQDTARKLKIERDFNKDIVDTIQALMVTISPCGTIVSFNRKAESVTGYTEPEILGKYWVDVMTSPE